MTRLVAAVAAVAALAAPGAAQHLQFRHLRVDHGLPSSWVTAILRDRRGFMWIGTADGLSRYDAYKFRTFRHDRAERGTLPHNHVEQLYEDRRGTLWVVTAGGLSRYDPARERFETFLGAERAGSADAPRVTGALEDGRGAFWVGTSRGLFRLDRRTGAVRPVPLPPPPTPRGLPAAAPWVTALFEDRASRVWVGTRVGVYQLDAEGRAARVYAHDPANPRTLPDTLVWTLAEDAAGDLWVGTGYGGLGRIEPRTGRVTRHSHAPGDPHSVARGRVTVVRAAQPRGLWVGVENGGLDYFDPATGHFVHQRHDPNDVAGLSSNSVWSLYQDPGGALWVGTFSGGLDVSRANGAAIRHFRPVPGDSTSLSHASVPAFAEGRDGTVWVATDGGGLNRFDPRTGRSVRYRAQNTNLNSDAVLGVLEDRAGAVWVATWGGGVSRLDPARRRFTAYTTATSNIPDNNVYELLEDRHGRLWVGTANGVVARLAPDGRTFDRRHPVAPPGLAASSALVLRELRDGTFAVGLRDGGLTLLDPATGAQRHHVAPPAGAPGAGAGLASNHVRAVLEGPAGELWVGTDDGLDRLDRATGRFTHFGEADGLPGTAVQGIVPDAGGRLWLSTNRGVCRFDPGARVARCYTGADGLQGSEFLMRSALRTRDGAVYFGGNNGFNAIRPDRLAENTRRPPVVLTELSVFNRPVAPGEPGAPLRRAIGETGELTLARAQNVVTFEFAALDFTAPGKNEYAYRLDGFDEDWQHVGHRRTASYTNLAPGRYTFRVKASNNDGVWNDAGTSLRLVVRPAWWQTWWFRLAALLLGAAGVYRLWRFQGQRRLEIALSRRALTDPLTGLANRDLFHDRVGHALAQFARAAGGPPGGAAGRPAVLFLDLDDFKRVNDSLGHHAGDALLRGVAARLLNATRGCDTVARFGGDEFAVLLERARDEADARVVADRITASLREPVRVSGPRAAGGDPAAAEAEARVGVSVGVAFAEPGMSADELLRNADAAMYQAKGNGKGHHAVFDPALVAAASERLALGIDLTHALARGELALAYQPVVDLATGAVTGAEALLRWRHPARGAVSPAQFIPLAEESGLIVELGRWVLEEACRAAAAWPPGADGPAPGVAVNVSGRQLLRADFPAHVAAALAASGLAPGRLTLEITETVLMRDTEAGLTVLRTLKALGVRLAIDDFGTGYSSLRYLQQFPVDVLKIDKSFVDGVARPGHDAALARTIVALGRTLGLRTVAEGVEHETQRERLAAMGCESGQGYLFARPADDAALRALLAARTGAVLAPA